MSKQEAVLLIGRGKTFRHYIQGMIEPFARKYRVLVLELDAEISYSGPHLRLELPESPSPQQPDFWNRIKSAEEFSGLNLFDSYSNYLYYGRLAQESNIDYSSYWWPKERIGSDYLRAFMFMQNIVEEYDLKFVFHDTIDLILLQMVEAFSRKLNFGFYHTLIKPGLFDNRVLLSYGIARKSALFTRYLEEDIVPTEDENREIDAIVGRFMESKPSLSYLKNSSQKLITLREIKKIPARLKNIPYGWKRLRNRIYLQKQTTGFSLEKAGKYILFFLSHQPEATTTSAASRYVDQWKIIEELAVHGPSDVNIVIKAHPFGYGWQGKEYFERLLRLENVLMTPISYPGKELIQNAHTVITINGSIGLEALIYDIPAYTLGDAWYSYPGLIQNLDSPNDLLPHLDAPRRLNKEQKYKVLAAAYRASFEFMTDFTDGYVQEKRDSGKSLATHVLENRNIYFTRVDL